MLSYLGLEADVGKQAHKEDDQRCHQAGWTHIEWLRPVLLQSWVNDIGVQTDVASDAQVWNMETQHHGSMDECVEHLVKDHYPPVFPDVNAKTAPITITVPTTE